MKKIESGPLPAPPVTSPEIKQSTAYIDTGFSDNTGLWLIPIDMQRLEQINNVLAVYNFRTTQTDKGIRIIHQNRLDDDEQSLISHQNNVPLENILLTQPDNFVPESGLSPPDPEIQYFIESFNLYFPYVVNYFRGRGIPPEQSEDWAQTAMLKFLEKIRSGTYKLPYRNIKGLIFTIAQRVEIDHSRLKKNNNIPVPFDETDESDRIHLIISDFTDSFDSDSVDELADFPALSVEMLSSLTDSEQLVLYLNHLVFDIKKRNKYSKTKIISQTLETTEENTRLILYRAINKLKNYNSDGQQENPDEKKDKKNRKKPVLVFQNPQIPQTEGFWPGLAARERNRLQISSSYKNMSQKIEDLRRILPEFEDQSAKNHRIIIGSKTITDAVNKQISPGNRPAVNFEDHLKKALHDLDLIRLNENTMNLRGYSASVDPANRYQPLRLHLTKLLLENLKKHQLSEKQKSDLEETLNFIDIQRENFPEKFRNMDFQTGPATLSVIDLEFWRLSNLLISCRNVLDLTPKDILSWNNSQFARTLDSLRQTELELLSNIQSKKTDGLRPQLKSMRDELMHQSLSPPDSLTLTTKSLLLTVPGGLQEALVQVKELDNGLFIPFHIYDRKFSLSYGPLKIYIDPKGNILKGKDGLPVLLFDSQIYSIAGDRFVPSQSLGC